LINKEGGVDIKKIIQEFDKKFPREKGMFWTPDYKGIIEYLRTVYFKGYRQGIQDIEKNKEVRGDRRTSDKS